MTVAQKPIGVSNNRQGAKERGGCIADMLLLISAAADAPDDREFMTQLYLTYERLMYATARKMLADPEAVKDIVQESVLRLIPKIHILKQQDRCIVASYVVSAVRNTAINYMRKRSRTDGRCGSLEERELIACETSLDELILLMERKERLTHIWSYLPEGDRVLLEGKYILGYNDTELADFLGCKKESVRMKLTRARRRALQLMLELEKEGGQT